MESNKIFAALLTAGIVAYLAGFAAHLLIHPKKLAENAYPIEVTATTVGGAPAAPATAEPINDLLATADAAQGEKIAKMCGSCHTFGKGEAHKVGPNLAGIIGSVHAHASDFAYSDAMKAKSGEKWTVEKMNEFLFSPKQAIPGTKMSFAGLKKAEDRAALIKWLQTQK